MKDLKVETGTLDMSNIIAEMAAENAIGALGEKRFNSMTEEQRASLIERVEKALDGLRGKADEWVPVALRGEVGEYIDVTFRLLLLDMPSE